MKHEAIATSARVVTWNVWFRFGPWEQRGPAIESTLAAIDPDVVCLQEVWEEVGGEHQAARIAARLAGDGAPFHWAWSWGTEVSGLRVGNAIVSRWPILRTEQRFLPSVDSTDEQRTVLLAELDGPRGALQVFCTHLNWRFDQSHVRREQVAAVCRFVSESRPRARPPLLCGDFNADPMSDEIRCLTGRAAALVPGVVFHDAWEVAGSGPGDTWSNANPFAAQDLEPARRIDYVLTGWPHGEGGRGHAVHAALVGVDPVDGVQPSDHYGVVADILY